MTLLYIKRNDKRTAIYLSICNHCAFSCREGLLNTEEVFKDIAIVLPRGSSKNKCVKQWSWIRDLAEVCLGVRMTALRHHARTDRRCIAM